MWTLKLRAQPTNAFFATVNQMFGGSSQLPTTAEYCFVVWSVLRDLITARPAMFVGWLQNYLNNMQTQDTYTFENRNVIRCNIHGK